ncbi:MAG: SWIM zinc finger family protein [Sandaracinus sp.]|nr:SWIM zinc finger family protein [Sandaracinus sp.]
MSTEEKTDELEAPRTAFAFRYPRASAVVGAEGKTVVDLVGNGARGAVKAGGRAHDPLALRESLSALYEIVRSDFRYVPKDRTAYLAYQRLRKQSVGMDLVAAQQAYYGWIARNDPNAWMILDPIVSVHPDELLFEVFSKDEGCYAKLGVKWSAFELEGEPVHGTTNVDFTQALHDGVQKMRSYRETRFAIGGDAVSVEVEGAAPVIEKKIQVPDSWVRGFLQVQSAATLPATRFSLAPVDLYNVLRHLRLNADPKKGGRALRFELVPGETPKVVLEPWGEVLEGGAEVYRGKTPQVIRVWGRRRLSLLRRMLPFVERVDVHLLGTGLPSFFVLQAGPIALTLGLSGFTTSNWAQAVSFDLLLPRTHEDGKKEVPVAAVIDFLKERFVATEKEIAKAVGASASLVSEALQRGCQEGKLMYDLEAEVYRYRPLSDAPLELERFTYRNLRERRAYDLLAVKGAVKIDRENRIFGEGLELTAKVAVAAENREYRPQLMLDEEGRVRKAECTCAFFRKHQLKEGPCEHLVALRVAFGRLEAERRAARGKARDTITVETRTYQRRDPKGEQVCQIALDDKRLKVRKGRGGEKPRVQNLVFDSVAEARAAYFAHVDDLEKRGFLDASAS